MSCTKYSDNNPWKTLKSSWYKKIYKYSSFTSKNPQKSTVAVDIYYLTGTSTQAPNDLGYPDVLNVMIANAKKVKSKNTNAVIFEKNAFIDCNLEYHYWALPSTYELLMKASNSLPFYKSSIINDAYKF